MFSPYLNFPMNGEEMLRYYQSVFGGELDLRGYTPDVAEAIGMPVPEGALAHGMLHGGLVTIAGGDAIFGEPQELRGAPFGFMLQRDSVDDARALIDRLVSDGGTAEMPFDKAPWGDHYGQAKDRFGVLWHVNVSGT